MGKTLMALGVGLPDVENEKQRQSFVDPGVGIVACQLFGSSPYFLGNRRSSEGPVPSASVGQGSTFFGNLSPWAPSLKSTLSTSIQ